MNKILYGYNVVVNGETLISSECEYPIKEIAQFNGEQAIEDAIKYGLILKTDKAQVDVWDMEIKIEEELIMKKMYLVTVKADVYDGELGVQIGGVFDTEKKALEAKQIITEWLNNEGFEDYHVFAKPMKVNELAWYEITKEIK